MSWGWINSFGLLLSLAGVVLLFRYGIPYKADYDGYSVLIVHTPGEDAEKAKIKAYKRLGWLGLFLIVAGTLIQIWVSLKTM